MKLRIFISLFLPFILGVEMYAQRIVFDYDATGNRIKREIRLTVSKKSKAVHAVEEQKGTPILDYLAEKEIKIYPNPTRGRLKLEIMAFDIETVAAFQVFNIQGGLLLQQNIDEANTEIDLSGQPNGVYLLYIVMDGKTTVWKIIKE